MIAKRMGAPWKARFRTMIRLNRYSPRFELPVYRVALLAIELELT